MTKEQTLSDKAQRFHLDYDFYCETDVKLFIKKLKEEMGIEPFDSFVFSRMSAKEVQDIIDKLAGEKLI